MTAVIHVISDRQRHHLPLLDALVLAAQGGADVIQIREKKAPAAETYAQITELQQHLSELEQIPAVFVNDRVDIALSANLAGVHLAAKSLPLQVARSLRDRARWSGWIGCSVHSLDEAMAAERAGADYVTFGHVFSSQSHPGIPPRGLHTLRRVVDVLSIPVIAIGGIDHKNVQPVLETNCSGIAVIGAVLNAEDPFEATRALRQAVERSSAIPKVPFSRT